VQRYQLVNGLRVWIEPRPAAESITALLVVRVADLQRMVETYYVPVRRYAGLHHPIVTVPRGGRLLGAAAIVGVLCWLWRKLPR
jgi:hypothetical protein